MRLCSPKVAPCCQPSATVCVTAVWLSTVASVEWSRKRVKLTRGAADILAFAEEVSVRVMRGAAVAVCVTAARLSTAASASGVVPTACQVDTWRRS